MKSLHRSAFILAAALICAWTIHAEDAAAEKTKAALKTKATFEFLDTPLSQAIDQVATAAKIKVQWDAALMADHKKNPISLKVKDMECGTILDWVCKLAEIEFNVVGDHIGLTPPKPLEAKKNSK